MTTRSLMTINIALSLFIFVVSAMLHCHETSLVIIILTGGLTNNNNCI